jgi:hypothetical protein
MFQMLAFRGEKSSVFGKIFRAKDLTAIFYTQDVRKVRFEHHISNFLTVSLQTGKVNKLKEIFGISILD